MIDDSVVERRSHWTESFRAADWDGDGLTDLIMSYAGSHGGIMDGTSVFLFTNMGTPADPVFALPRPLMCFGEPIRVTNHGPNAWIGDMDDDGRPDVLTCVEWSVYPYFSHSAVEMESRPEYAVSWAGVVSQ